MPSELRSSDQISDLLPLRLLRSQVIPPAPNRRRSSTDFLHDFGGLSWIAYGASSLLVISHFPSPLNPHETLVGPSFYLVVDPSVPPQCSAADVFAVSWSSARPSAGEIAVAAGNCVFIFSPDSFTLSGSFCWRQTAAIVQCFAIEAIGWTGSGNGLIAAGIDVVMWRRKSTSWEIAWKLKAELPQALISATWYAEGLVATAANLSVHSSDMNANYSSLSREDGAYVSVYHSDGDSGVVRVQLCHPLPVTMIQWRPTTDTQLDKDALHPWRDVLLTCCLDGTLRLWSEIDNSRARKYSKDMQDQKSVKPSFHVIAVIEIHQCMKGTLGIDISINWAIELGCVISKVEGDGYYLTSAGSENDQIGKCEWLIGLGPAGSLTFWAIHCLDDMNPLRFPRVTLWKKHNLMDFTSYRQCNSDSECSPILVKSFISRNRPFGPPVECSLLQLLPNNSVGWYQLYTETQNDEGNKLLSQTIRGKSLSCFAGEVLNLDGHTGNILQLAIHPYYEIELAVSLDSDGFLFFWSLPTISNCTFGMQMLGHPVWKFLCKINLQEFSNGIQYSSLKWAPPVLDENLFLLLGYIDGIDCFLIKLSGEGKGITYDKIFTIPFTGHCHGLGPPGQLSATPLSSTCGQLFFNSFLLFATWAEKFEAASWKIVLHSEDAFRSNRGCRCDDGTIESSDKKRYISSGGKIFLATIDLGSSVFPDTQSVGHVISVSLSSSDNAVLSIEQSASISDFKYHMATGCSDGTVKLWKMFHAGSVNSEIELLPWELVGEFTAHEGPVNAMSLSSCGGKIATVSMNNKTSTANLHIWNPICLIRGGNFLLEDAIYFDGLVVALNWLSVGNGHLLLAVCMQNELRIYSEKRYDPFLERSTESRDLHIWCCIAQSHAYPVFQEFQWGPKATPVLIHKTQISLFSQWLLREETESILEGSERYVTRNNGFMTNPIFSESDYYDTKESKTINEENGLYVSTIFSKMFQLQYDSDAEIRVHSLLDIVDGLCEPLAVYHPMALLQHLYLGNWRRAYVILKHLVGAIKSSEASGTSWKKTEPGNLHFSEIDLLRYFEEVPEELGSKGLQWGQDTISGTSNLLFQHNSFEFADFSNAKVLGTSSTTNYQKSEFNDFIESLEQSPDINALRNIEITQVLAVVDLLAELSESRFSSVYNCLDKPGRRFWIAVRFERLNSVRKFGPSTAEESVVNSKLLGWAIQSDCQDNLLGSLLSANPSWLEMRNLGVGFWFTDVSQLRTRMEKLARLQYLSRKDPKDCALLYLALNRLQVLAGLFKISRDEKDKLLAGFLSRNFQEEKNKAAALKNAYVLMGRHQLNLAVAFFLLGGDPSSAVTVCAKNLGDEQLALVICRLIEGNGGQLERQLISNVLLPSATEKKDHWLASLLEWLLGNYFCSISRLLDSHVGSVTYNTSTCNLSAFSDPDIGQYCLTLAAKNNLKNAIGDNVAMVLSKLAMMMVVIAYNRCGFPLEALESFSSSYIVDGNNRGSFLDNESDMMFIRILNPFSSSSNWLLISVASHLELNEKLNLAMQCILKLVRSHPRWLVNDIASTEKLFFTGEDDFQDEQQVSKIKSNLALAISKFEHKHSLNSIDIANMILVFTGSRGQFFLGYQLLQSNSSQGQNTCPATTIRSMLRPVPPRLLLKASQEISLILTCYVVCCNLTNSMLKILYGRNLTVEKERHSHLHQGEFFLRSVIFSLRTIKLLLKLYDFHEGFNKRISSVFDLLEFCVYFASSWFSKNVKGLTIMMQSILNESIHHQSSFEVVASELMKMLCETSEWIVHDVSGNGIGITLDTDAMQGQVTQSEPSMLSIPIEEMWQLIGVCLWEHLSDFANHQLRKFLVTERIEDGSSIENPMNNLSSLITKLFMTSMAYISSSSTRQLASFLQQKVSKGLSVASVIWLDELGHCESHTLHNSLNGALGSLKVLGNNEGMTSQFQKLWELSVCPEKIYEKFVNERVICFTYNSQNFSGSWKNIQKKVVPENEKDISPNNKEGSTGTSGTSTTVAEPVRGRRAIVADGFMENKKKGSSSQGNISSFHKPMEILKRGGELIEAICFNSINEQQVAAASNRKGLLFFEWKTEQQVSRQAEYIWEESDWPQDGWARVESRPVPTYGSPGIGLGSKRGEHLGLSGSTKGLGSLARPGRDLTGGGAFGIPGYAGIGASGLGWGELEDFEQLADPPATVANISGRVLSRHPCRPLFLVGSNNTHIYLWEFGKERATATYGVLPASNVPPPYALASISSLHFDHFGQRFASAALDGTISTWQLEVGGRCNVYPTESSFCFSNYASDVSYVGASGSILVAAGCSTNGFNVVVWDTLAPPGTSQASVVCHEGGARSLAVFDNDVGSGSISPLIVTGGKSGDVGLHDFRFIATGKSKHYKSSSQQDLNSAATNNSGMLWYIPKAHLGSVTKVSTIPNTSLFLTGGKDGDVKLWDAKSSLLVCHWQKMHERHTFLQPNSRSLGGVVRAAVTDIQVFSHGFLTCGGDGSVKLVHLK